MSVKFKIFLVLLNIYCTGGTSEWTKDKNLSTKNVARQLQGTYHVEVRKRPSTRFNWINFPSTKINKYQQAITKSVYTKRKITNLNKVNPKSIKPSTIKVTRTKKMTPQEDIKLLKSTNSQSTLDLDETTIDNDTNEMSTATPTAISTEEEIDTSRNENTATENKKVTNNSTTMMPTAISTEEEIDTSRNENTATEKKKVTNNKTTGETNKTKEEESKSTKNGKSNNAQTGKDKKSTRREKVSVKKKTILNPYDLKNDLLKIMSYLPNANATAEVIGRTVEYKDIVLLKITDANGNKKVRRADVNELKKDRGEDIGKDVETTNISKDTTMQNENTNKGTDKEIKVKNENKSVEITTEMDAEGKQIIFIVHGLSTLELWKIPCLYETTQLKLLISFYLSHLKNFDIFLIPVANPDGLARKENYWNKNMSPQEGCGGVALDRNFDIAWTSKSNVSSCDQFYPGPEPFSEAETEAIKDVFLRYGKRMAAYIHVHATDNNFDYRGNTVLIPKGYTDEESDEDKYLDLKGEIDEAMRKAFNTASVNVKTVYSWYGPVAGTSVDYAAEIIGVQFAMEFLMQPYPTTAKRSLNQASLTHIWKRVIDTVFTFIHKINNSDESD